ncbi:MAG: hypothetical protein KAU29_02180, partial [Gammaproteobacteria bacterium]|nr:hypothetical protein [Gammaproteobacteria bacterium]
DASTVATTTSTGLSGAAGDDRLFNLANLTVMSGTETNADSFSLSIAGSSSAGADATADASATGLSGGEGHDKLINESILTVKTASQSTADSMSVTIFGGASASADTTTNATSIAMDGGADNDLIVNSETGYIDVYANTQSVANASSWNFAGAASAQATLGAVTDSYGILGGGGEDWIENSGGMKVETYSDLNAYGSGENIFGSAEAGTEITATAAATGINSGDDDDVIKNNAVINVASTGDMYSRATSFSLIGGSSTDELITAQSHSVGINSGSGDDEVYNWSQINVDATSLLTAEGGSSVAIGGSASSAAIVGATTSGQGVTTGDGDDILISFEGSIVNVNVSASPKADTSSSAGIYWSDGVIRSTAVSSSQGYGFNIGDGHNSVLNEGDLSVALTGKTEARGTATADEVSNYLGIDVDAYATTVSELKENLAYGIKAGDGDNVVENSGSISVSSTAEAETYASANGQAIVSGDGTANATGRADNAYTSGIETGDGDNWILNSGTVTVSNHVNSDVDTYSDADGIGEFREPDSKSTSVASADDVIAVGIRAGDSVNEIINQGTVSVTSAPTADAYAFADHGGDWLGIDTEAKTFVDTDGVQAIGILTGNSGNLIWNKEDGAILVAAAPSAIADSYANGVGWDGDAGVRADAQANNTYAAGIDTGNSSDSIQNDGVIDVTAAPLADTRAISSRGCDLLHINCGENEFGDGTTPGQWA